MNLRFSVIWIEDNYYKHEQDNISEGIRRAGFEPKFFVDPDGSRIDEFAEQQQRFNDFDFLLLDLQLGDGVRGDDLAHHIRDRFRSIPILFYSSEPVEQLRIRMLTKKVEGVFCAHRQNMPTRVGEMVTDLSTSLNRLAGMRGLAAQVVAECDDEFRAIILEACARPNELDRESLCDQLDKMVKDSSKKAADDYGKCVGLESRLWSRGVTSYHLWMVVMRITRAAKARVVGMAENRLVLTDYNPNVIGPRNKLSHILETRGSAGWQVTGHGEGQEITVANFPKLRSDFITHLENVKAIRRRLAGEES